MGIYTRPDIEAAERDGSFIVRNKRKIGNAGIDLMSITSFGLRRLHSPMWSSIWQGKESRLGTDRSDIKQRVYQALIFSFFSISAIFSVVLSTASGEREMLSIPHFTRNCANSG